MAKRAELAGKVFGHLTVLKADGLMGPATIKAMQRKLGTPADGIISPSSRMVIAMQQALNAGRKPL